MNENRTTRSSPFSCLQLKKEKDQLSDIVGGGVGSGRECNKIEDRTMQEPFCTPKSYTRECIREQKNIFWSKIDQEKKLHINASSATQGPNGWSLINFYSFSLCFKGKGRKFFHGGGQRVGCFRNQN